MSEKIIIGLAGKIACGKETASKYLAGKYNGVQFRYSDPLRDVLSIFDLPYSRENLQDLSTWLRTRYSEDILAKAIIKKTNSTEARVVVIDGVRRYTDVENFFKIKNFYLLYIDADQRTRYQRYVVRDQSEGDINMDFEEFVKRDNAESESQIEDLKSKANFIVKNNNSLEEFFEDIDKVLGRIIN